MLTEYVTATKDVGILNRALPLAEVSPRPPFQLILLIKRNYQRELDWWKMNRTINVTSPFTNETHSVARSDLFFTLPMKFSIVHRYSVVNSAPRPESYLTDYTLANDPKLPALNESQRSALYAELASGAETGRSAYASKRKFPLPRLMHLSRLGLHRALARQSISWAADAQCEIDDSNLSEQHPL